MTRTIFYRQSFTGKHVKSFGSTWDDLEDIAAYWTDRLEPERGEQYAHDLPAEAIRQLSNPAAARAGGHLRRCAAICVVAEERLLRPGWVPHLSDPDDEPMLQLAVEAQVPDIVKRNFRHLKPALSFGIHVLTPGQFLKLLNPKP